MSARDYEITILLRAIVWPEPIVRRVDTLLEYLMLHGPMRDDRLIELALEALDAGIETRRPSDDDLRVLMTSTDHRVRLAGIRLSGIGREQ